MLNKKQNVVSRVEASCFRGPGEVREKKQRRKELMERRTKAAEEAEADVVAATDVPACFGVCLGFEK